MLRQAFFIFFCCFSATTAATEGTTDPCRTIDPQVSPQLSYDACTALVQRDAEAANDAFVLTNLGLAARDLDLLNESAIALEAARDITPNDTALLRMLAWTYRRQSKYEEAEALYTLVLKTDDDEQGWLSRCVVRSDQQKWPAAISDCEAALKREPNNPDTLFFLAYSLNFRGPSKRALEVTQTGIDLHPTFPRLYAERAWALHLNGNTKDAIAFAQDALKRFPNDPQLQNFLNAQ